MGRLFWKILLTFWLTLLVTGGLTGLSVWLHQREVQTIKEEQRLQPSAVIAIKSAANAYEYGGRDALQSLLTELQEDEAACHSRVLAVDDNGEELLGRTVPEDYLAKLRISTANKTASTFARMVKSNSGESFALFIPKTEKKPKSMFFRDHPPRFRGDRGRPIGPPPPPPRGWLLIVIGILTSFVSSFLLAWYFSRPIRSLRSAFQSLAAGNLDQRVASEIGKRRDDLADLGKDFDDMADQLQSSMSSQRRLLHDVSHELRSPLARLHLSIGLAHQKPEKIDSCLNRIELEARKLDKLVGEVLTLSRLESGTPQPMNDFTDILELLNAVIEDVRFEADALSRKVIFNCDVDDRPIIKGHSELLHRALENVLRNALHHTPKNTTVTLNVCKNETNTSLLIHIEDQGTGVPESELEKIFDPFQRSSNIKTDIDGFGLGLAIAQRSIQSHHGSIRALNLAEKGLRIEITLPLYSENVD